MNRRNIAATTVGVVIGVPIAYAGLSVFALPLMLFCAGSGVGPDSRCSATIQAAHVVPVIVWAASAWLIRDALLRMKPRPKAAPAPGPGRWPAVALGTILLVPIGFQIREYLFTKEAAAAFFALRWVFAALALVGLVLLAAFRVLLQPED